MIKHTAQCDCCNRTLEEVVLEIEFEINKIELCIFEYSPYTTKRKIHLCFDCYNQIEKLTESRKNINH